LEVLADVVAHICFPMKTLVTLLLLVGSTVAQGQGVSSAGTEYWLGFMPNYINPAQDIQLFLASETANRITIEQYGGGGKVVRTIVRTLAAEEAVTVQMNIGEAETRDREQPVYKAIRVTSTAPCVVYGFSDNSLTTDGYLALPLELLGKKYYCLSYYDDAYTPGYDHLGGEFLIVAPYDNTEVVLTSTATTTLADDGLKIGHRPGDTWTVTLNAGQTYLVQTTGWNFGTEDLTGSSVESSKPVAFLTGHQRASIEIGAGNNSKDHLIEMLLPVETWATEYFVVPQNGRTRCGDYIRALSAEDGNIISVNGSMRSVNAGEMFDVSTVTTPTTFRSTNGKRFIVMDYSYTQGYNGDPGVGDPFMIMLPGKQHFQNRMVFRTPSKPGSGSYNHYATFISTSNGLSNMKIKAGGKTSKLSAFGAGGMFPLPGSSYHAQRVRLSSDELAMIAESDELFAMYLYGYASVESYGWLGGLHGSFNLQDMSKPVAQPLLATCSTTSLQITDAAGIAVVRLVREDAAIKGVTPPSNFELIRPASFVVGDTLVIVEAEVVDLAAVATATLEIIDRSGNSLYVPLSYTPTKVTTSANELIYSVRIRDTLCESVTLTNPTTEQWSNVSVQLQQTYFTIVGPTSFDLAPGATRDIQICYSAGDDRQRMDSLVAVYNCTPTYVTLKGKAIIPRLTAADVEFGVVDSGVVVCTEVALQNTSATYITVTGFTSSMQRFYLEDPTVLPLVIPANESATVRVCHRAQSIGKITEVGAWQTDSPADDDKDQSQLHIEVRPRSSVIAEARELGIDLWPNPAKNKLHLRLHKVPSHLELQIVDARGVVVAQPDDKSHFEQEIDLAGLHSGSYHLVLTLDGKRNSLPFIKE
jgi:hypothetical protein